MHMHFVDTVGRCFGDADSTELRAGACDALHTRLRQTSRQVHPYHCRGNGRSLQGCGRPGHAVQGPSVARMLDAEVSCFLMVLYEELVDCRVD